MAKPRVVGTCTIDLAVAVDYIVRALQDVLQGVFPYLAPYPNIALKDVEADIVRPVALESPDKQMLDVWPLLLTVPTSPSEVASMVAVAHPSAGGKLSFNAGQ